MGREGAGSADEAGWFPVRLCTVRTPDGTTAAVRVGSDVVSIPGHADLSALLRSPNWQERAARSVSAGTVVSGAEVVNPFPTPGKIICAGLNYRGHIVEMGRQPPEYPTLFAKFADTLTGPFDPIAIGDHDASVDWEGELAVVMSATAYRVDATEARDRIAGYAVANDISMRTWQNRTSEWLQGKIWAQTTPIGPDLVTPDEVDLGSAVLRTTVNGQVVQQHGLDDLVFGPEALVSYISTIIPLRAGDIILTGTPGGVGHARTPPVYLQPGDVLETSIAGIGRQRNEMIRVDG